DLKARSLSASDPGRAAPRQPSRRERGTSMGWTKSVSARWWVAIVVGVGVARSAAALFLDDDQTISLRARVYSQAAIRLNDGQADTTPKVKRGQLVQHRNYFNPELEAKLTSRTAWMKGTWLDFLAPDDFSARLAAWGF